VPNESVTDYGDYEKVGGVYFALEQEFGPKASQNRQKVQIETAEANVAVEDMQFHFPAAAPSAPTAQ
jgi:hypothetical protein